MKIPLSNRLRACCDLIRPDDVVADIGCDHGYLGIHLLTTGGARRVLAGDVNPQPLESAIANAEKFGVRDKMRFYLSDGLKNIPRDLTVAVLAGMGADTMIAILDAAPWIRDGKYRLVLQCQSHRSQLRRYLYEQGFQIRRETLAQDGKFIYPVMEVVWGPTTALTSGGYYISPALIQSRSPLLPAFYQRILDSIGTTVEGLRLSGSPKLSEFEALLQELKEMEEQIHGQGM